MTYKLVCLSILEMKFQLQEEFSAIIVNRSAKININYNENRHRHI